jgi:hypothetical protein
MLKSFPSALDHLVYTTPDVDKSIDDLFNRTGVHAQLAGRQPVWETRNAILALVPLTYLEIMGPDFGLSPSPKRPFGLDHLQRPCLATWVARSGKGDLGVLQAGSRRKPDRELQGWNMTSFMANRENGVIPYLVDWGSSPHPAQDSPKGCALKELRATHSDPARIKAMLQAFGFDLRVEYGQGCSLVAVVETPNDTLEIE